MLGCVIHTTMSLAIVLRLTRPRKADFAELLLHVRLFPAGQSIVHEEEDRPGQRGNDGHPLDRESDGDEEQAALLWTPDPGVQAVGDKCALSVVDASPALVNDEEAAEHQRVAHEVDDRHHDRSATEERHPEVPGGVGEWVEGRIPAAEDRGEDVDG